MDGKAVITCDVLGYHPGTNNGLGNQMFCIASTLALAAKNGTIATFPDLQLEHYRYYGETIFHKLNKIGTKDFVSFVYREPPYSSTVYSKIPFSEGMKISGHFQSYKYFESCRDLIVDNFTPTDEIIDKIHTKYKKYLSKKTASLHIRRGDYTKIAGNYAILGPDYYKKALASIGNVDYIFIFSDDIEWCRENINFLESKNTIFISDQTDVEDLWLMSLVENNIIANSTFSWWAAYLNQNKNKKVIYPSKWFGPKRTNNNALETKDLFPEEWIKIQC